MFKVLPCAANDWPNQVEWTVPHVSLMATGLGDGQTKGFPYTGYFEKANSALNSLEAV